MGEDKNTENCWKFTLDRVFDTIDIVVRQMTSGRWILTVAAAYILIHYATQSNSPTDAKDIISLCKDIVLFYFVMRDLTNKPGGKDEQAK